LAFFGIWADLNYFLEFDSFPRLADFWVKIRFFENRLEVKLNDICLFNSKIPIHHLKLDFF
jgi:hypothetical protein